MKFISACQTNGVTITWDDIHETLSFSAKVEGKTRYMKMSYKDVADFAKKILTELPVESVNMEEKI